MAGRLTGVVMEPDDDMKKTIADTALFVVKQLEKGKHVEDKLLESDRNKFSFINAEDRFNGFYKLMLHQQTVSHAFEKQGMTSFNLLAEKKKKPSFVVEKLPQLRNIPKEQPPPFKFAIDPPRQITVLELEKIKLTAQFIAKYGRALIEPLRKKMADDRSFGFLNRENTRHFYFQNLIDQYLSVSNPTNAMLLQLKRESEDRTEWEVYIEQKHQREEAAAAAQQIREEQLIREGNSGEGGIGDANELFITAASIDWHDFIVVETISFDDIGEELLPPLVRMDISEGTRMKRDDIKIGEDGLIMPKDEGNGISVPSLLDQQKRKNQNNEQEQEQEEDNQMDMDVDDGDDDNDDIKDGKQAQNKHNNKNQNVSSSASHPALKAHQRQLEAEKSIRTVLCPNCNQYIPESEIKDHMKYEKFDMYEHNKKKAAIQRTKVKASAETDSTAKYLTNFALHRPDIFAGGSLQDSSDGNISSNRQQAIEDHNSSLAKQNAAIEAEFNQSQKKESASWDGRSAQSASNAELAAGRVQIPQFQPQMFPQFQQGAYSQPNTQRPATLPHLLHLQYAPTQTPQPSAPQQIAQPNLAEQAAAGPVKRKIPEQIDTPIQPDAAQKRKRIE